MTSLEVFSYLDDPPLNYINHISPSSAAANLLNLGSKQPTNSHPLEVSTISSLSSDLSDV